MTYVTNSKALELLIAHGADAVNVTAFAKKLVAKVNEYAPQSYTGPHITPLKATLLANIGDKLHKDDIVHLFNELTDVELKETILQVLKIKQAL